MDLFTRRTKHGIKISHERLNLCHVPSAVKGNLDEVSPWASAVRALQRLQPPQVL